MPCGCGGSGGGDSSSYFPSGTVASTTLDSRFAPNPNDSNFVSAGLASLGAGNFPKAAVIAGFLLVFGWVAWETVSKRKSAK